MENDSRHYQIIARDYWENKITSWNREDFFIDFNIVYPSAPGDPNAENGSGSETFTIDPLIAARVNAIANNNETAEYIIYLSFFAVLLYRYYRQPETAISSPGIKTHPEENGKDRFFFYKLVLKEHDSLKEMFRETGREIQETWKYSGYNYEDMETLFKNNNIDPLPLYRFGVSDNRINVASPAFKKVNLQFCLAKESSGPPAIHFKFNESVFKKEFIQGMASHYKNLLSYVDGGLDNTTAEIEILSPAEKRQLLEDFNGSAADFSLGKNLSDVFREKAGISPGKIALKHDGIHLTYGELKERAESLACVLWEKGVQPGTIVAMMMERSVEMIIGILGILKAGSAYLPIDPEYPEERIDYMLKDSGTKVVVNKKFFGGSRGAILQKSPPGNVNLAYIIYTSGSTGKPKGVMVEHRNVLNLVLNEQFTSEFGPDDVWTLFHSICFDVSVWELFGALLNGSKLIIVSTGIARTPRAMAELLEQEQVTILSQIPTVFMNLAAEVLEPGKKRVLFLRYIIFAGDALKPSLLAKWCVMYPGTRLVNMYGITETTVHVTYKEIGNEEIAVGISNIGQALPAWRCYIADHGLRLLPVGIAGEILVGGAGVARGYLNRPDLTADRFVANPYVKGDRLYRSGDLARWLPGGNMEFLGRIDHQVKIRGFRVECGEIETHLLRWKKIKEAVVVVKESSLVAYLVTEMEIDIDGVRQYLLQYLPDYMIPEYFIRLERFPLTPSGKIDKKALPDPRSSYSSAKGFKAPRTHMENILANIWQDVLGIEKIGVHDNFFSLGGNSIKGIQVVNQVQEWLEEIIHVSVLFEAPTVEKLAAVLEKHGIVPGVSGAALDETDIQKMRRFITPLAPLKTIAPKNPSSVFILAPPRSGTTLLRVILAGHPGLFAPPELELLSYNTLLERKAALSGKFGYFKEGVLRAVMEIKQCSAMEAQDIMLEFERRDFTSQEFYRVLQQWLGDRILVDKTPWYALDPETLKRAELYFDAPLYIHLVRDPHAVIHSFEKANLDQIFRYNHDFSIRRLAELIWLISHENILEFLKEIPGDRQYRVNFEELIRQPEIAAAGLCKFLHIDYRPELINVYQDSGSKMLNGIHPESKMLGDINFLKHKRIEPEVADKWKHDYKDDFLGDPTRNLAKSLGYLYLELQSSSASRYSKIESVPEAEYYELSNVQKRLWILAQLESGSSAYNIPTAYIIDGKLNRAALEKSYRDVVKRHEILRTTFIQLDGEPKQKVHDAVSMEFKLEYLDLRNDRDREENARKIAADEMSMVFDLEKGPLLRVKLQQLEEEKYLFLLILHHIITDAWSMGVLVFDMLLLYNAYVEGRENPLSPLPFQYKDYSAWQNKRRESGAIKQQAEYWLEQFVGEIPIMDLPLDFPRPPVQSFEGKTVNFELTAGIAAALKNLALEEGATSNMLLLTLFNVFLAKLTHQQDIIVGTPITGRRHVDFEGIIGMFVNTLALRNYPADHKTFREFLREVKEKTLAAFENQEYQFEDLIEEVCTARDVSRNPLFDVMFVLQNINIQPGARPGQLIQPVGFQLLPYEYENRTAKFDLTLFAFDSSDGFLFTIEFSTRLFKEDTVGRFMYYFKQLGDSVLCAPDQAIAQLEIIPDAEKTQLLYEFNNTAVEYPGQGTVHRLFEEQVERTPDQVSLFSGCVRHIYLTYRELSEQSNRLACLLIEKGVLVDSIVGIKIERSIEMLIGILGILKAGGAYLPIDPDYPEERIDYMLKDSGAKILLIKSEILISKFETNSNDQKINVQNKNIGIPFVLNFENLNLDIVSNFGFRISNCNSSNLIYLIYTSGSTGRPKGVMLEHRNIVNLLNWEFSAANIDFSDHVLQFASIGFDVSVQEIFSTLLKGGTLFLIHKDLRVDVQGLFDFIRFNDIAILFLPPAFLRLVFTQPDFVASFPRCVRHILAAGEQLIVPELLENYLAGRKIFLHNYYGPAETHVVTTRTIDPTGPIPARPSIGGPIANTQVYILDKHRNLQPIGVKGELYISGSNVGRGYLNRSELTAEKFGPQITQITQINGIEKTKINKSFAGVKGGLFQKPPLVAYRTGDLARWLPGGNIEFLGRDDHQVKLRGFRIELEEIEARLLKQKEIKEAVVIAKQDEHSDMYLCAYFVPSGGDEVDIQGLREALAAVLPDYMVPAHFISLEKIPLNSSGKLDRKALPEPGPGVGKGITPNTAPVGEIQQKLATLWAEVLKLERNMVSVDANFFHQGGHSLKATVLLAKIHKELNVQVPLTEIFKNPTIRGLTGFIKKAQGDRYRPIEPVEKKEYYAPSSAQKRLYILQQIELGGVAYNMPRVIRLHEAPDLEMLEQTFKRLIHRHESLRTSFIMVDGDLVQKIHDDVEFEFEGDLPWSPDIIKSFIHPFDLSMAPLFRVGSLEIEGKEYFLMVDMHHIITDGVSQEILVNDFISLCRGEQIPQLELQYKDFSEWQNNEKEKEKVKQQEKYWLKEYEGDIPILHMPLDYPRPEIQQFEGNTVRFELDGETTTAIKKMTLAKKSTLFITLLTIYNMFLSKLSRQEDIVIGTPIAGRSHADLEKIIGMFVNTLPLRNYPAGEKTFEEFLPEVKKRALKAIENQDYQFEDLVEKVFVKRDAGRNPLFDVVFVFLEKTPTSPGEFYEFETWISKFDLTLTAAEEGDHLSFSWEYCVKLYKSGTIERFINCFKKLVSAVIENPGKKIAELEIIPEKEKRQVLFEFNRPWAIFPRDRTIHELFEEQVKISPDNIAIVGAAPHGCPFVFGHGQTRTNTDKISVTYRELNEQSDGWAGLLMEKGVKPDTIVAIIMERSIEMIIGILGILKANGAYLPIDPGYPQERIDYMLKDSGVAILLTDYEKKKIANCQLLIVNCQLLMGPPQALFHHSSFIVHHSSHLAYIIYTSGTTGKPKGVMIEHRNVVSLMVNNGNLFNFDRRDIWTLFHSFCFDFSIWEMYGALLYGGKLVIISQMVARDTRQFLEILKKESVTVLNQTPEAFYNLANLELQEPGKQLNMKYVIFGGDILKPGKLKQWQEKYTRTELINMFGITETTVHVTYKKIEDKDIELNISNIGHPLPPLSTYVIDKGLKLAPLGVEGELCVSGKGVGRGYLNRPELTKEKFENNPSIPDQKLYKSGDLGRFLENGEMEHLGRIDFQVKIRGYRIEPGEIESRLLKNERIKEVVVIARQTTAGSVQGTSRNEDEESGSGGYLCAYIVPAKGQVPSVSELREYLALDLPGYMIPTYFVIIENIPLTVNGKIDRQALPGPIVETSNEYIAPRDETEETLTRLWQQVLTLERAGIRDNYFNIGGDSIKAIKLLSVINREFNINLRIVDLFTNETIEKLSTRIKQEKGGYSDEELTRALREIEILKTRCLAKKEFAQDDIEDIYPMSDIEKGMVYHALKESGQAVYHDQTVHQPTYTDFDPGRFKKALALMVDKHQILRTSFNLADFEEPVQVVHKNIDVDMEHYDISHMTAVDQEEYIRTFMERDRKNPFVLSEPPLWRMRTFALDKDHIVVLWVCHHAVIDGWSDASFNTELNNIFLELKTNPAYVPAKLKSSYKEYILEQLVQKKRKGLPVYWTNELQDYKRLEFPGTMGNRKVAVVMKKYTFDLGISLLDRSTRIAAANNTSLKHLSFAAYMYMLNMISYENDLITGLITNNRPVCEDGEKILGCFLNTVPVRVKIPPHIRWSEYIRIVDQKLKELARYDRLSLLEIVKLTGDEISDRNPLFDAIFNYVDFHIYREIHWETNAPGRQAEQAHRLSLEGRVRANTSFDFSINSTFGEFTIILSYSNSLLTDQMVLRLIHYFREILNCFIQEPTAVASKEGLMGEEEKQALLYDFNGKETDYPKDKTIHELFKEQVGRTPDNITLSFRSVQPVRPVCLTYRELNEESDRLAGLFMEKGVRADTIVGIMMESSIEMLIDILGILKAGGAYLPIDPAYPQERIDYMLKDSGAKILVNKKFFGGSRGAILQKSPPGYANLAYIIYTSGSTGVPNGVMVEHRALVNLCSWHNRYYSVTPSDRAAKFAGVGFDASIWEIFPYLIAGASLYFVPGRIKLDVGALNRYIEDNRITIAFLPTQMGEQFLETDNRTLRILLVGGDKLRFFKKKRYEVYNNYGPTENTVVTTACRVEGAVDNIPIGKPIDNTRVYIMGKGDFQLQPVGIAGELCIAGNNLARGYLNKPELTAKKFIMPSATRNPFEKGFLDFPKLLFNHHLPVTTHPSPLYRTGDLARWLPGGNIEILGRMDHQVKVRGFRIELGEIETRLLEHKSIKETVVITVAVAVTANTPGTPSSAGNGHQQLCAYIVLKESCHNGPSGDEEKDVSRWRDYLAGKLPAYMIPSYFIFMDKIPMTPNGKIDRKSLPRPETLDTAAGSEYAAPTNAVEEKLATTWRNVLGREKIGVNENFFMNGGDSIKAIQVISRMNNAGYKVELKDLFSFPTISQLAPNVRESRHVADQSVISGPVPLAPIQRWFFESDITDNHHFNQAVILYSVEGFEEATIKTVFTKIQEHHDTLRMTYEKNTAGEMIQIGHSLDYPLSLTVYDFRDKTGKQEAAEALETKADELQASICLEKGPLLKLGLFRLPDGDRLLIVIHHLAIDGISWRVLFEDIDILYRQYKNGEPFSLPLKTDSFKHWTETLSQYADSKAFLKEKTYWTQLASQPAPLIEKDFAAVSNRAADTRRLAFQLSEEETGLLLTRVNEAFGTGVEDILLTALALGFHDQFGLHRLLIAMEGHGREDILKEMDISRTVGWFTSVYPLLLEVSHENDLARQIKEVKETLRRIPQKGIGWGILKYLTSWENKEDIHLKLLNLQPQVSFNYLGQVDADNVGASAGQTFSFGKVEEPVGHMISPNGQREYLLDISGIIFAKQLVISVAYNEKHFKSGTVAGLQNHFQTALHSIISFCSSRDQKETTPSDFGYNKLSIEELESLFD